MQKRKINVVKVLQMSLAIVLIIAFLVIAAMQMYESVNEENLGDRVVLGIENSSDVLGASIAGRPVTMGNLIGIVSNGSFMVVDKKASNISNDTFMLSDPIMEAKGQYCVVGDYNGERVRLYQSGQLMTEATTEGKIINVTTNSNGFFAVATAQVGYDAVVTVYRPSGEAIYRYVLSNKSFVDMDISENNRRLLIISAGFDSQSMSSTVIVAEFNREAAEVMFDVADSLYFSAHFNANGSFVCIGGSRVDIYRVDGQKSASIDYSDKMLICADISTDNAICLAFSSSEVEVGGSVLEIYDRTGKKRGESQFSESVEYICVNGAYIAVSYGKNVDVVRGNGRVRTHLETTSPVQYAAPFADGRSVVVFSGGNTEVLKG